MSASAFQQVEPIVTMTRAEKLNAIGSQLFSDNHLDPARLHFLAALVLEPDNPRATQNLGAVLRNMRHYAAAEAMAQRAVTLTEGKNPFCKGNLGVAKIALRKFPEALELLKEVCENLSDKGHSWHNYGLALYITGQYERALECFNKSLSMEHNAQAAFDRSLTLLSLGRIQEGLEASEARWDILQRNRIWSLNIPEWKGEALDGRRILVHHEQGFGDSLMLVRFLTKLSKWPCQIVLAVPKELKRLFQQNFPFVKVTTTDDEGINEDNSFDFHTPLLSLMRWLGIEKPRDISFEPYLSAKPESPMQLPNAKSKIGICWASGNHGPSLNDRRRVIPLTSFLPLLEAPGVALISLQMGDSLRDIITHGLESLVFDVSPKIEDFADTARLIACLDLVITVDSAVAHLAGALGKPCLMLSPYSRCWRWWGEKTGWPWYNRMKIFTQEANGSWDSPMRNVVKSALWMAKNRDMG